MAAGTRLLETQASDPNERIALDLVRQAMHWKNMGHKEEQDQIPLRIQHYGMALSLLHASRSLKSDAFLEREAGFDVGRAVRTLEAKLTKLRQSAASPNQ